MSVYDDILAKGLEQNSSGSWTPESAASLLADNDLVNGAISYANAAIGGNAAATWPSSWINQVPALDATKPGVSDARTLMVTAAALLVAQIQLLDQMLNRGS